jgi:integrase
MANIRKRGQKWQARVSSKHHGSQAKSFSNKADALRWARETERLMETGAIDQAHGDVPFKRMVERYLYTVTPSKKGASQERYRLIQVMRCPLVMLPLREISAEHIAAYRDERLAQVSRSTVRIELSLLSAIFERCRLEWGLRVTNPVAMIRRPRPTQGRTRRLRDGEWAALRVVCDASGATYLGAFVRLAVATGMRFGELATLQWQQVAFERSEIHLIDTKNGHPRVVPLSAAAVAALHTLPKRPIGAVFDAAPGSIKTAFRVALARGKRQYPGMFEGLRFHDLRHEATSRLLEQGLNVFEAASVTGHRSMAMISRYTHVLPENVLKKLRKH